MLSLRLVVRSALIIFMMLALVVAYPVFAPQGSAALAQGQAPVAETPEPQPEPPNFDFFKLINNQAAQSLSTAILVDAGSALTFRYEVANTGGVTLTWLTLVDTVLGDLSTRCDLPRVIPPGGVEACDIPDTAAVAPDGLQNIATATVSDLDPKQDEAWYRTPPVVGPQPAPSFSFSKTVNGQDANSRETAVVVPIGSSLVFRYQVNNTGDAPLQWVSLVDDVLGDLTAECQLPITVPVGGSAACDINRPAGTYPDGLQNIGRATVVGLPVQEDVAWYRTLTPVGPEATPLATPPVPIPEPITIILFGTGLAALSAAAASRRRQE